MWDEVQNANAGRGSRASKTGVPKPELGNQKYLALGTFLLACCLTAQPAVAGNWPQFRGPDATGVSVRSDLPLDWSATENVLWKRDLPGRGWSSPIVWGDRVLLTAVANLGESEEPKKGLYFGGNRPEPPKDVHQWKLHCLNLRTGEPMWEKLLFEGVPEAPRHIKNSYASETPVTDGERVYAYFGDLGLFCLDMAGNELWQKRFPPVKTRYGWGTASSPVLHGDRLYILNDNDDESWLACFDKHNGDEIWRVPRDEKSNWGTPFVWENAARTEIIAPGTGKVRSYDLEGNLLYEFGGMSSITTCTPYARHGLLFVSSGYVLDDKKPLFAIKPGASGDISLKDDETSNDFIAWCQKQGGPYNPSTIVYDDLLYVLLDRGFLSCYEATTGTPVYERKRIPEGNAFTASPWAYRDRIFCLNEDGVTFVLAAGREFKLHDQNALAEDDMCMATPALADDKLLIRTAARVYCVRASK